MAKNLSRAIFCNHIGEGKESLQCCYLNDQNSQTCRQTFSPTAVTFRHVCLSGNCIQDCSNVTHIYRSIAQSDAFEGDNSLPIKRFRTCANVPAMSGFLSQSLLEQKMETTVGGYIPRNVPDQELKMVTYAVTECLISTCRNARRKEDCIGACSSVNMLVNGTTPDLGGVNNCLVSLCQGGYGSLPYADTDVVGVGVFISYIIQCFFVIGLFFALCGFEFHTHRFRKRKRPSPAAEPLMKESSSPHNQADEDASKMEKAVVVTHKTLFEDFAMTFHQTQCYYSITLQIASLSYGIFKTNMLITFMLTPLAMNGILPVVISYILLLRCNRATLDISLLTLTSWFLSTIVYWSLYASIVPINSQIQDERRRYRAYQQFMYKLSAIDACGGYSALAVCPNNFALGKKELSGASTQLRVFTPIAWTFATFCFFVVLAVQLAKHLQQRAKRKGMLDSEIGGTKKEATSGRKHDRKIPSMSSRRITFIYYVSMLIFMVAIAMQLSFLSIGSSLEMMDAKHWSFGQIIAVAIWLPPLRDYGFYELMRLFKKMRSRQVPHKST